ncbi:MAG: LysR family transcriptional regulator [Planctomycetota bacterium]
MRPSSSIHVQHLHSFRHVFEQRGYAAAARMTHQSVPTVWQHIQSLERAYGVALFEKQGRKVEATEAARRLYSVIDEVLESLDSTFDLVNGEESDSRPITIVAGVRMMMEDLTGPLKAFRRRHKNRVLIRHGNNRRAEELLVAGEADLALSLEAGSGKQSSAIEYSPAYFVDFLAAGAKQHPFFAAKTHGLRELVKHDLIVTAPGTHGRDALDQALFKERLTATIGIETDNSGFTIACAKAGMGLGVLAGRPDGTLLKGLATQSLFKPLGRRQIVFMWRKGRRLTSTLQLLVDVIRDSNG